MRIALVTGGAGGLGFASALKFVEDGMTVVIADLKLEVAQAAAAKLGKGHHAIAIDVASEESVISVFDKVEKEIGPISVLAHFAGALDDGGIVTGVFLADFTVKSWQRVFDINALGTFLVIREMARRRRDKPVEHGRIITISSLAGQMGGLQAGVGYAASKAAVIGITKKAARELAAQGITVNNIAPGPIDTDMLAAATPGGGTEKFSNLSAIPMGRVGRREEIAEAARYLASKDSGFITGQTIGVNGGMYV